jgi:cytidylate kinase
MIDTRDPSAVAAFADAVKVDFSAEDGRIVYRVDGRIPGNAIRTAEINANASYVAVVKEVRDRVTSWLRSMVEFGDLIVEGRDITTAVFPESPARFFLTASADARAQRRHLEEQTKGINGGDAEAVKASLLARDAIDSTRKYAPLRKADGVIEIDSTSLTLDEVVDTVLEALPAEWH